MVKPDVSLYGKISWYLLLLELKDYFYKGEISCFFNLVVNLKELFITMLYNRVEINWFFDVVTHVPSMLQCLDPINKENITADINLFFQSMNFSAHSYR